MTVNQWREEEEGLLCLPRLSIYLSKVKLSFLLSPPMSSSLSKTWKSPPLRLDGLEYAWGSNSSPFALGITLHRISSDVIDVVQSSEGDFKLESPSKQGRLQEVRLHFSMETFVKRQQQFYPFSYLFGSWNLWFHEKNKVKYFTFIFMGFLNIKLHFASACNFGTPFWKIV